MDEGSLNYLPILLKDETLGMILLVAATLLLFGFKFEKSRQQLPWYQNIFRAGMSSILFLGIVLGGNIFLKSNINSFGAIYQSFTHQGSISWVEWTNIKHTWPGWITQKELVVNHFIEVETVATLPATDTLSPLLYKTFISHQQIPQNSIVGFVGNVELTLENEKSHGFNGYLAAASFKYEVVNQSDLKVESEFLFPLDTTDIVYQNIFISVDGIEMKPLASVDGLLWKTAMLPRQKVTILVSYEARGLDGYTYSVPETREINNFSLIISSNSTNVFSSFVPSGESINYKAEILLGSFRSRAVIDEAVASPSMSVFYVQNTIPYSPQDIALHTLRFMPRASIFLAVVFLFTLLISNTKFRLMDLLLFQALAWITPLVFMIICLVLENQQWALFWAGSFTAILQYFFLKNLRMQTFPLFVILIWVVLLAGIYPLSGQKVETYPLNQYDNFILIGMMIYIFSYALFQRINRNLQYQKLN